MTNSNPPCASRKEDDNLESSAPNVQIDQQTRAPVLHNDFLEEVNAVVRVSDKVHSKRHRVTCQANIIKLIG